MAAQTFQYCIEQNYEEAPLEDSLGDAEQYNQRPIVDVRNNGVFLDEYMNVMAEMLRHILRTVGGPTEMNERSTFVGLYALYALHSRLVPPRAAPTVAFYQKLWEGQKKVPMVSLYNGKAIWLPAEFLLQCTTQPTTKLYPREKDIPKFRKEYTQKLDQVLKRLIDHKHSEMYTWSNRMQTIMPYDAYSTYIQQGTNSSGGPTQFYRHCHHISQLILQGIILAASTTNLAYEFMSMHVITGAPMTKIAIPILSKIIEILKSIELICRKKEPVVCELMPHICRNISTRMKTLLQPCKARLKANKTLSDSKVDLLSCIYLLERIIDSGESYTKTRRIIVKILIQIITRSGGYMKDNNISELLSQFWRLNYLCEYQSIIKTKTNCSFLYHNDELLPMFLKDVLYNIHQSQRLHLLFDGFNDVRSLLLSNKHLENSSSMIVSYREFLLNNLYTYIITPISRNIENNLRLHIHSVHLKHMKPPNPKDKNTGLRMLGRILEIGNIRVLDTTINIKQRITEYLTKEFYELTVLALHDWKTYGEMKSIAKEHYDIDIGESHLPMGTIDQGLDVLQIMRNIHIFVTLFNYNINQQFFIEKKADKGSKHLNTINVHSIANSIRTHGTGMMNTCVNFTYQFLAQKFYIFREFLCDPYICSYLSSEKRYYNNNDKKLNHQYGYQRAYEFTKDIRKLGVTNNGLTFLDQFRKLITEIGNALGYVRMVRSAGLHATSNAIKFLPDLTNIISFEKRCGDGDIVAPKDDNDEEENKTNGENDNASDMSDDEILEKIKGAGLCLSTVRAATQLDSVITNLIKNFSEGIDYFKVLVDVFQEVMENEKKKMNTKEEDLTGKSSSKKNCDMSVAENQAKYGTTPLSNFYMIIPSLSINYIDNIKRGKERMVKSHKGIESYFTDDGFAIGTAYILTILKQTTAFRSLHWFEHVHKKYNTDVQNLQNDIKEIQTEDISKVKSKSGRRMDAKQKKKYVDEQKERVVEINLEIRRKKQYQREYELLFYSFSGAKIFFKTED